MISKWYYGGYWKENSYVDGITDYWPYKSLHDSIYRYWVEEGIWIDGNTDYEPYKMPEAYYVPKHWVEDLNFYTYENFKIVECNKYNK